jgi:hypothetical protein
VAPGLRYYERLRSDHQHDFVLRCGDCSRLVRYDRVMRNHGLTPCCGTRKLREVSSLRLFEWLQIWLGVIRFPFRREFLAEFPLARR